MKIEKLCDIGKMDMIMTYIQDLVAAKLGIRLAEHDSDESSYP